MLVAQVVYLLDIMKVGIRACSFASKLAVVERFPRALRASVELPPVSAVV